MVEIMAHFSERSKSKLYTCHKDLQGLFSEVVANFDCTIIEGHRGKDKQDQLYPRFTQVKFPNSKHNSQPSKAIDVAPYPIDWSDYKRMYYFAGYVRCKAEEMDIAIRWGGDWDNDTEVLDNVFNDLVHFELI
jgi:peptidoglycan L-alanyl-D-glutamate endopeptidase CwlK